MQQNYSRNHSGTPLGMPVQIRSIREVLSKIFFTKNELIHKNNKAHKGNTPSLEIISKWNKWRIHQGRTRAHKTKS